MPAHGVMVCVRLLIGVVAIMVGFGATWADHAHAAIRTPTAQGSFACGAPGTANITWTILNYPEAPVPIAISSASMSGAATGPVSIAPASIAPGATGSATVAVDGAASGTVVLSAEMTSPFTFTIVGQVTLDGRCALPPSTTDPPPTAAPATSSTNTSVDPEETPAGVHPTYVG